MPKSTTVYFVSFKRFEVFIRSRRMFTNRISREQRASGSDTEQRLGGSVRERGNE